MSNRPSITGRHWTGWTRRWRACRPPSTSRGSRRRTAGGWGGQGGPAGGGEEGVGGAEGAVVDAQAVASEAGRAHLQAIRDAETKTALDRQAQERRRERQE